MWPRSLDLSFIGSCHSRLYRFAKYFTEVMPPKVEGRCQNFYMNAPLIRARGYGPFRAQGR